MDRHNLLILLSLGLPGLLLFKGGQMGKFNKEKENEELDKEIEMPSYLFYTEAERNYLLSLVTLTGHLINGTDSSGSYL